MKVDFMIIGAQKCATTSLFDLLDMHSQLQGCEEKEPAFFSNANWKNNLDDYHKLFKIKKGVKYFEASTQYTFFPHVENKTIPLDLYNYNPELKFIYIVRDPLKRIVSSFSHGLVKNNVTNDIDYQVLNNPFFIDVSKYAMQIKPYIEMFGRDRILIIDFDDFINEQAKCYTEICHFLAIEPELDNLKSNIHSNSQQHLGASFNENAIFKYLKRVIPKRIKKFINGKLLKYCLSNNKKTIEKPVIDGGTKQFISQAMRDDISEFETIIGKSLKHWSSYE